jgi:hypothetical protein
MKRINQHPKTGIAFGIISCSQLDPDTVDQLFYGPNAVDVSYIECLTDHLERVKRDYMADTGYEPNDDQIEEWSNDFAEQYEAYEPKIEGHLDGVAYTITWLGGAPEVIVLESPVIGYGRPGSPCVPGMAVIPSPSEMKGNEWYEGYTVPLDWWAEVTA